MGGLMESRPAANVFEHTGIDPNQVDEFLKIDKYEMELGKVNKKVREKITDMNQMVKSKEIKLWTQDKLEIYSFWITYGSPFR